MSDTGPDAVGRFVGGLVLAVGLLIALFSGACTLSIGGAAFYGLLRGQPGAGVGAALALVFGGGPFAVGVLLMVLGWRMIRPRRRLHARPDVFGDPPPPA